MAKVFGILTATRRRLLLVLACLTISLGVSWQALVAAQEPPDPASVAQKFSTWSSALERVSRDLNTIKPDATQLETFAEQVSEVRSQVLAFAEELEGVTGEARELRDAFVAATPDAAESEEAKAQGSELTAKVLRYEGWERQANLTLARTDQLLDRISSRRLAQLANSLSQRGPMPINPIVWWRAAEEGLALARFAAMGLMDVGRLWVHPESETGVTAASVLGIAVALWLAALVALHYIARRPSPILRPTLSGPATRVILAALAPAVPWVLAGIAGGLAAPIRDWLPLAPGRTVVLALLGMALTAMANLWAFRAAVIQPPDGVPSIVADETDRAILTKAYGILLTLFALDVGLQTVTAIFASINLIAVWTLLFTLIGVCFARQAVAVVNRLLANHGFAEHKLIRLILLILPVLVAALAIVTSVLGFAEFARYMLTNSLASAVVCFAAWGLRKAAQEIVVRVCDIESPAGRWLRDKLGADQAALRLAQFWLSMALDIANLVLTVVVLMVVWGTGTQDAFMMIERLVEGVRVGNITLSLADLVIAILTFMTGVWITRFVQRLLEQRVFPGTQLDLGVRNSLRSGLGYIGVMIAAAFAILVLGLDLSNLALVAGALSVGIGFGLQNIINNFVSGLILLIERPVKVGDWISVGGNEGIVKRINVRSTEIITDTRASVLIPNADFLSVSVTNLTHKDLGGRLHLTFKLPEDMGAAGGRELLMTCAKGHPKVLADPPVHVHLLEINDGYTLELIADIADVTLMKEVGSDLRFAVDQALQARKAQSTPLITSG